jgi:hypothetical protein
MPYSISHALAMPIPVALERMSRPAKWSGICSSALNRKESTFFVRYSMQPNECRGRRGGRQLPKRARGRQLHCAMRAGVH